MNGSSVNIKFSKTQLSKMIYSGGVVIPDIHIFGNILSNVAKKETDVARNLGKDFLNKQVDKFSKEYITSKGSGIILTKNEWNKSSYKSN